MEMTLTRNEKDQLQQTFRILFQNNLTDQPMAIQSLLDENILYDYLKQTDEILQTDQLLVVGSQLIKRLTNTLLVPALYTLAVFNKKMDLSTGNRFIISAMKKQKWMPYMYSESDEVTTVTNRADRNAYLEESIREISYYVQAINKVAKVPTPLLWENAAVYIYKLYESKLQSDELNLYEQKEAWNDFAYLLQLKGDIFQTSFNPLQRFYTNKIEVEGKEEPVRVRRTCCFNYETNSGKYCKGCPKSDVNKEACMRTKRHVMAVEMVH
ncbi:MULTISPECIES: (2Fe-2S)-binding protein [Allobacillus]|uniref:Ferric siderophore reductase C-terminal domain-containing protein n=1 Tax=Allobacillus salarius TaxID=1955272 RepID=A0A556PM50_9BACI|nr:hypothetical protein [Allobacillus salarius]TSJ65472.1 hypothetical protein FPQ13_06605 [Allobacillus salarius]